MLITIACRSFQDRKIIRCFAETRKYSTYWYFEVSSRLKYSLNWFCGSIISRGLFSFRNKLDRSMPVMCLVKKKLESFKPVSRNERDIYWISSVFKGSVLSFSLTCIFSLWNDLNNQIYSRSSLLQFKLGSDWFFCHDTGESRGVEGTDVSIINIYFEGISNNIKCYCSLD